MQASEDIVHDRRRLPFVLLALALSGLAACGTRTDIRGPGGRILIDAQHWGSGTTTMTMTTIETGRTPPAST